MLNSDFVDHCLKGAVDYFGGWESAYFSDKAKEYVRMLDEISPDLKSKATVIDKEKVSIIGKAAQEAWKQVYRVLPWEKSRSLDYCSDVFVFFPVSDWPEVANRFLSSGMGKKFTEDAYEIDTQVDEERQKMFKLVDQWKSDSRVAILNTGWLNSYPIIDSARIRTLRKDFARDLAIKFFGIESEKSNFDMDTLRKLPIQGVDLKGREESPSVPHLLELKRFETELSEVMAKHANLISQTPEYTALERTVALGVKSRKLKFALSALEVERGSPANFGWAMFESAPGLIDKWIEVPDREEAQELMKGISALLNDFPSQIKAYSNPEIGGDNGAEALEQIHVQVRAYEQSLEEKVARLKDLLSEAGKNRLAEFEVNLSAGK